MIQKQDRLYELAERIREGDSGAHDAFRREIYPGMMVQLRYALCIRKDAGLLAGRARREANRLRRDPRWQVALGRENLMRQLARRICEDLIERLASHRSATHILMETVLS